MKNTTPNERIRINRLFELILFLLLGTSIIFTMCLGMKHFTTTGIISISFDWMSMLMLTLIYRNICNGRAMNNTAEIKEMTITLYMCVLFESGTWLFDSLPAYRILNYVCNIGANCTILLAAYLYFLFITKSRGINADLFPKMKSILQTTLIVGITAEVMNCVGGYFYTINEAGVYIRGPYGSVLGYLPFMIILLGSVLFITKQSITRQTKLSYLSYYIVPFICSIWYTFTGYPPTFFVAGAFTMQLIHGDIYIVQSRDTEILEADNAKKEVEYALSQNMLMLSQIKPHFMYNALGSIEVLCKLDPEKAGRAIHHFSQYLRSNMNIVKNEDTIPFSKELEHVRNYVWLEQMRFEDELNYREEIEVTDFRVPQLAIQPMVENAVKHGMMGNEDGILHVTLKTQETDSEYIICICDDGCGFDPKQTLPEDGRSHIGIRSAEESLRMRVNGTMHIDSRIGSGTTVTIRIPKAEKGENV